MVPSQRLKFLESKGLTQAEIKEALNRVSTDEELLSDYDPVFILNSVVYEEFLRQLDTSEAASVKLFLEKFISECKEKTLQEKFSMEAIAKELHDVISAATKPMMRVYRSKKIGISPTCVSECIEKYLMCKLHDFLFAPTKENLRKDGILYDKIKELGKFLTVHHLDIPSVFQDVKIWSVAQQGKSKNSSI